MTSLLVSVTWRHQIYNIIERKSNLSLQARVSLWLPIRDSHFNHNNRYNKHQQRNRDQSDEYDPITYSIGKDEEKYLLRLILQKLSAHAIKGVIQKRICVAERDTWIAHKQTSFCFWRSCIIHIERALEERKGIKEESESEVKEENNICVCYQLKDKVEKSWMWEREGDRARQCFHSSLLMQWANHRTFIKFRIDFGIIINLPSQSASIFQFDWRHKVRRVIRENWIVSFFAFSL